MRFLLYLGFNVTRGKLCTPAALIYSGILCVSAALIYSSILCAPAFAQQYSPYSKSDNPNIKHFYMGRQEIEVLDTSPIIKYRGGPGGQSQGQSAPGQGPAPLSPGGFQQYSSGVTSGPSNLPKVVTGVPPKAPQQKAIKGSAGKLSPRAAVRKPASAASPGIETYKKTYQMRPQPTTPTGTSPELNATKKVKGKLLPWANTRRKNY